MAINNELSLAMFNASQDVYNKGTTGFVQQFGYKLDQSFGGFGTGFYIDETTGFSVVAFESIDNPKEKILAFAGTEGLQDAYADLNLGWVQWTGNGGKNREAIIDNYLSLLPADAIINFAGHSLGGALAQYAMYDYVDDVINAQRKDVPNITLTTFNGLGGETALAQNFETLSGRAFDLELVAQVQNNSIIRNYRTDGDLVSRL
ncbi:MAG: hypothetical protein QM493_01955, partial [Sulfurovum sp.]